MGKNFTHEVFIQFRNFIHENYGIYYSDAKKELLNLKLNRCLTKSGIKSFEEYYDIISSNINSAYSKGFIDEITVNKTDFFREIEHYNFIQSEFEFIYTHNPQIMKNREIRAWSMACSSGQEAYSLAMVLNETVPKPFSIKVLATDISNKMLKVANAGIYPKETEKDIDRNILNKYFSASQGQYHVNHEIKQLVTFRQFNLMNEFPFSGKFDIIFCRNVMIYFNLETQQQLLSKIYQCLADGGLLFIGQSESILNKNHNFKHIKSTIYIK